MAACPPLRPSPLCCSAFEWRFALIAFQLTPPFSNSAYGPTQWEQVDDTAIEASGKRLAALYSTKLGEDGATHC